MNKAIDDLVSNYRDETSPGNTFMTDQQNLNDRAHRAGIASVMAHVDDLNQSGVSPLYIALWLLDRLIRGADDEWSGRSNDIRRCYHDGVLEGVRRARYVLSAQITEGA